ncbi:lipocalin family protein [Echinicola sp. CAU 1574]|uniref:Lipocalin family protein n=1 Tax=Echinicola arenosa TaxID=2774144 RepID=A0ABR9AP23_9BACT|nr:lipocalin family protein [Echinicola arenosa]MBD8490112.1 lipocalin family protein [Echinicola arenosa]
MKTPYSFFLSIIMLLACHETQDPIIYDANPDGLIGTWQQVERSYSIGGPQISENISDGPLMTFEDNGLFTLTKFNECSTGTYILDGDELTFTFDCKDIEEGVNPFTFSVYFLDDYLKVSPKTTVCIEGCSAKFKKLKD